MHKQILVTFVTAWVEISSHLSFRHRRRGSDSVKILSLPLDFRVYISIRLHCHQSSTLTSTTASNQLKLSSLVSYSHVFVLTFGFRRDLMRFSFVYFQFLHFCSVFYMPLWDLFECFHNIHLLWVLSVYLLFMSLRWTCYRNITVRSKLGAGFLFS